MRVRLIFTIILLGIGFFYQTKAANITVIYPNGGENLEAGKTYKLQWNGSMTSLKLNNGYVIVSHDDYSADPAGSYLWTVPLTTPPGSYNLEAIGCCGSSAGSDTSDGQFSIIAPTHLYSYFRVSPADVSENQPVTFAWEINGGVQASLKIECPVNSISFLNSQRQKIYHCGEVISDLPLVTNFDLRPQDFSSPSLKVNFILSVLEVGGRESIYGNRTLTVEFRPMQLISGYSNYGQYLGLSVYQEQLPAKHIFKYDLEYGMDDSNDVKELQKILTKLGFFKGEATGNFYGKTLKAVKAFQKKYGIKQTGYVGPKTRGQLNNLSL